MDKSEIKSGVWIGVIVGALMGEIGFLISLPFTYRLFGLRFIERDLGNDMMLLGCLLVIFLLPFGLGAGGGFASAFLAHKRYKRFGPWVGASIGGLLVGMILAFLVQFWNYSVLW